MGSSYTWDAEDYASNSAVQFAWARELLDKLELRGDEGLLDIGCGDGKVSAAIGARLPAGSVHGVDSSAEQYGPWLAAAGLEVERLELIAKDMAHEDATALTGWVRTTWLPYIQRVPKARRADFVEDMVACYLDVCPPDADGRTHVQMMRLEVKARKPR